MATAEIVAIGSELLLGQIVDTNSAWMAQRLTALGVNLYFKSVVGDNPGRMKEGPDARRSDSRDRCGSDRAQVDSESADVGTGRGTLSAARPADDAE